MLLDEEGFCRIKFCPKALFQMEKQSGKNPENAKKLQNV